MTKETKKEQEESKDNIEEVVEKKSKDGGEGFAKTQNIVGKEVKKESKVKKIIKKVLNDKKELYGFKIIREKIEKNRFKS